MIGAELDQKEDRPAFVRFETRAVESKTKTMEAGHSVSVDVDYALVTPPYSRDCVVIKVNQWLLNAEKNVRDGRMPQQWVDHWKKAYEAFKEGKEAPLNGTAIKEWSAISPAQIKNLIALRILTVEDLAVCNDEGLRRIGMGASTLRTTAINWLKSAEDHGGLALKMTQLEIDNERLELSNADLIAKNKALLAQIEAMRQPVQAEVNREVAPVEAIDVSDILEDEPAVKPIEAVEAVIETTSLAEQYEVKFGKKPHHLMKEETIRKKLRE